MKLPKNLKTLVVAPGFRNSEIYEAASQNYQAKLQALQIKYQHLLKPGSVVDVNVQHDDWCAALCGRPGCTCDPDVSLVIDGKTHR